MSRIILKAGAKGYYQGIDPENMTPQFSAVSPKSHMVVSFESEEELRNHIILDKFEEIYGKAELIEVEPDPRFVHKSRHISVEGLAKMGITDTDAMLNLLPVAGSC